MAKYNIVGIMVYISNSPHTGFGSMAACAAGRLCAAHIGDRELPGYAEHLSMHRYENMALMAELERAESKGIV